MDPFSMTSGAAGIISLGITACQGLIDYYNNWKDYDEGIKQMLESIESLTKTFALLQKALDNQQLDDATKAQACYSIALCRHGVVVLKKKLAKIKRDDSQSQGATIALAARGRIRRFYDRARYPFKLGTLDKLRDNISDLRANLQLAVTSLQLDTTARTLDKIDLVHGQVSTITADVKNVKESVANSNLATTRQKIRDWLSPCDPSTNFNRAIEAQHRGTGQWFLDLPEYAKWKTDHNSFFWAYGIPGCGKTVLSSTAIANLRASSLGLSSKVGLAYFYFDFQDRSKQQSSALVRSLMTQLVDSRHSIPKVVESMFEICKDGSEQPGSVSLLQTLREVLGTFDHAYVVIDALDECTERDELGSLLQTIHDWKLPCLHVLALSRKEHDLEDYLSSLITSQCSLQSDIVDGDIRAFVDYQLEHDLRLKSKPAAIKSEIISTITNGAQGMFRWAVCQLQTIRDCPDKTPLIRKVLKSLPRTLDETYERILESINEDYASEVLKLLQWLCFSEEPLAVEELAEALAIEMIDEPFFDPDSRYENPNEVLRLCRAFVSLSSQSYDRWSVKLSKVVQISRQVVQLSHFSVKEFLVSSRMRLDIKNRYGLLEESGHYMICQACVAYLSYFEINCPPKSAYYDYPLAIYAAKHWISHARRIQSSGSSLHLDEHISRRLGSKDTFKHSLIIYNYDSDSRNLLHLPDDGQRSEEEWRFRKNRSPPPLLYYTLIMGLIDLSSYLIRAGADVNAAGGKLNHPLIAAAFHGHSTVVDLLIALHVDLEVTTRLYGTALQAAAWNGHVDVVRSLLAAGAVKDTNCGTNGCPLHAAVYRGHCHIVELLLEANVNIEQESRMKGTALVTAIHEGYLDIVRLLLASKADPNHEPESTTTSTSGTPLVAAVNVGSVDAVILLLQAGADVNLECQKLEHQKRMTALRAAAYGNHVEIVRLLLEANANVHQKSKGYGTVLEAAASSGSIEIMRMLLETGADANAEGGPYKTALQTASAFGNTRGPEVIQLLIASGVSVSVEGGAFGSPLQAAAYAGNVDTMKLLLSHGASTSERQGDYGNMLECAANSINTNAMQFLLERGSDVSEGQVLEVAALRGRTWSIRFLLDKGALPKIDDPGFLLALRRAAEDNENESVRQLGQIHKAIRNGEYSTVLEAAKQMRQRAAFSLLLECGSRDDRPDFEEWPWENLRPRTQSEEREHALSVAETIKQWSMCNY